VAVDFGHAAAPASRVHPRSKPPSNAVVPGDKVVHPITDYFTAHGRLLGSRAIHLEFTTPVTVDAPKVILGKINRHAELTE
jgi:hypothetical protein